MPVQRMREAFRSVEIRQWEFPGLCLSPLDNAFTHVCDNCEITSKTRGKNEEQLKRVIFPVNFLVQLSCKRRGKRSRSIEMLRAPNSTLTD